MNKNQLRAFFRKKRASISPQRRLEAEADLEKLSFQGVVLSFCSFGSEIDTAQLNKKLAQEKRLALPLMVGEALHFYRVGDLESDLILCGSFYEPNPQRCEKLLPISSGTVLVPGLGFDNNLHRLGYGKGYYDRFFEKNPFLFSIGLGFKEQRITSLPTEAHDRPLSQILLL